MRTKSTGARTQKTQPLACSTHRKARTAVALVASVIYPSMSSPADGIVALQAAAPSCRATTTPPPIYTDCDNGTITDNRTGLVWLKNADCLKAGVEWQTAMEFVAGLTDLPAGSVAAADDCGLSDGSSAGEWRLASIAEWEAMVADAAALACDPPITNDAGTDCWSVPCVGSGLCSFTGLQASSVYWSSTSSSLTPSDAWTLEMNDGEGYLDGKGHDSSFMWPVRGGQ